MSTARVNLEQDEQYDYRFHVRPEGEFEVSLETLTRWASVLTAYDAMQAEMLALTTAKEEAKAAEARVEFDAKQAAYDQKTANLFR